jgi:hypothetical protein
MGGVYNRLNHAHKRRGPSLARRSTSPKGTGTVFDTFCRKDTRKPVGGWGKKLEATSLTLDATPSVLVTTPPVGVWESLFHDRYRLDRQRSDRAVFPFDSPTPKKRISQNG